MHEVRGLNSARSLPKEIGQNVSQVPDGTSDYQGRQTLESTNLPRNARLRKMPREIRANTTRGRPLGTRAPIRSWKERLIKMERYGGGHPAREKPHTSPRGNFTSRIHRWSSAGYALADISAGYRSPLRPGGTASTAARTE